MKLTNGPAKAALLVCVISVVAAANPDPNDLRSADSVLVQPYSFVQAEGPWPDSIGIPIEFAVDTSLGGYGLGFRLTGPGAEYFRITSIEHDGPCNPAFNLSTFLDTADGMWGLIGWIDFTGLNPCVAPQGVFATFNLQVDPEAPVGTYASLDSSFIPPGGAFLLISPDGVSIYPDFSNGAATGDPNIALGDTTGVEIVLAVEDVTVNGEPLGLGKALRGSADSDFTHSLLISEGDSLSFRVVVYYAVGGLFGFRAEGEPENASFVPETGLFIFVPDASQGSPGGYPPYEIIFDATDFEDRTGSLTVLLGVQEPYICGDCNADGTTNITDAVYVITYIFAGGPPPNPLASGDVNCDGTPNITDAVYLIQYIFGGGPVPCDPDDDGTPDC